MNEMVYNGDNTEPQQRSSQCLKDQVKSTIDIPHHVLYLTRNNQRRQQETENIN